MRDDYGIDDLEIYDEETMLYNHVVFGAFLRRANGAHMLPMSLILFEVSGRVQGGIMKDLAGILQDMGEDNFMMARTHSNRFAVFMSKTLESDAYEFLENYAGRLRDYQVINHKKVRAVIKTWESVIQVPIEFYKAAEAELEAGMGMNLKFVGKSRSGGIINAISGAL